MTKQDITDLADGLKSINPEDPQSPANTPYSQWRLTAIMLSYLIETHTNDKGFDRMKWLESVIGQVPKA